MRHYIGGLIELCEEIEGNYMFEIRNWCPTRLTQVNRPQASRTLTHVTHSILIGGHDGCRVQKEYEIFSSSFS